MRITGLAEAVWTQDTAWADLTQRLEVELEESFKVQANTQRPTSTLMELAKGIKQRRDEMHHPSSHRFRI
jgi:hypothetical protein